jgi:uracil DNA glycosylase
MLNNSVLTSKITQRVSVTTIIWLMLFREIIAVYFENHTETINTIRGQNAELLNVNVGGAYSYH